MSEPSGQAAKNDDGPEVIAHDTEDEEMPCSNHTQCGTFFHEN